MLIENHAKDHLSQGDQQGYLSELYMILLAKETRFT